MGKFSELYLAVKGRHSAVATINEVANTPA